jgi:hypothetical protein
MNKSVLAIVIAATLLISMVGILSANPDVTWAFDDDGKMYRQPHEEYGLINITIPLGESKIIPAENAAQIEDGVPFSAQLWTGQLEPKIKTSVNKKCTVSLGIWDGASFTSYGTSSEMILKPATGFEGVGIINLYVSQFTVPKNEWLAAQVTNTGTEDFTLVTDGSCYVTYPPTTDYPYPELCTVGLFGIGLLTLMGYVGYRRRTTK